MSDHFQPKPAPDMALAALKALSLEPQQAVLIGDSDIDVFTAQAAGLEAIGAGWGFRSPEVLRQAGARQILTHPTEILELVC